jgi:hypothetical protein
VTVLATTGKTENRNVSARMVAVPRPSHMIITG